MTITDQTESRWVLSGEAEGSLLVCEQGLSLWGGVDATTGLIRDAHHPQHRQLLHRKIVMMPTSRGSSSGGSVLISLAQAGKAPAALVFRHSESILTLGAIVAQRVFGHTIPVVQLSDEDYERLSRQSYARITPTGIETDDLSVALSESVQQPLSLSARDQAMLDGEHGEACQLAMSIIAQMAQAQRAESLIDVSQVHIDGCIYEHPTFLAFARKMLALRARVVVPTTLNAISVDYANWQAQGVDPDFGEAASELADCYVRMGARGSFTCAPYLLDSAPSYGDVVAWAESNAVVFANSVIGARTAKHPDFLDLSMAITGRAPLVGVYLTQARRPSLIVQVERPAEADDAFWPMLGWLLGKRSSGRIPRVDGLEGSAPSRDHLKAMCAAFGTTSSEPLLHVSGVTPEADLPPLSDAPRLTITTSDFRRLWQQFNQTSASIDLIALGSPHFSATECRQFLRQLNGRTVDQARSTIITLGRDTHDELSQDGTRQQLEQAGVTLVLDVCWCSISEPVFPPQAKVVLTNSGKYAHYGPGLSGRRVLFGSIADCARAAVSGEAPRLPEWLKRSKDVDAV